MKKAIFGIAIISLAFASCSDKDCKGNRCDRQDERVELYSGILPAADTEGILYSLVLDYDDDTNYTSGDFDLTQIYLTGDSISPLGMQAGPTSVMEGKFTLDTKGTTAETVKYITLTPKAKKSVGNADNTPLYFIVNDDNSITMVGSDLAKPDSILNYNLVRKN